MGRARGKLVLQPIRNERSRKLRFEKRRGGLGKKTMELSTLCGVDACAITYGPNGEVITWPEDRSQLLSIIRKYNTIDKYEREKRKQDIASLLVRTKKLQDVDHESSSSSLYPGWDSRLDGFSHESLRDLKTCLDDKLDKLRSKFQSIEEKNGKATKNPRGKDVLVYVDDHVTANNPMLFFDGTVNQMATLAPSNCYGDVGTSSTTCDGAIGSAVPDYLSGFPIPSGEDYGYDMDMMLGTDDSCLPHHESMLFPNQPPAIQAILSPPVPLPVHPPPLPQQQPSVPTGQSPQTHPPPPLQQQQSTLPTEQSMQTHPPPPLQQQLSMPIGQPMSLLGFSRWEMDFSISARQLT